MQEAMMQGIEMEAVVAPFFEELVLLFIYSIFIYIVDIVSYAMYPTIVLDYQKGKDINLSKSLKIALGAWKTLAVFALIVFFLLGSFTYLSYVSYQLTLKDNTMTYILPTFLLSTVFLLAFTVLFFFVIPIAIVEEKYSIYSIKKSIKLGIKHRSDVLKTSIMFLVLVFATLTVASIYELVGGLVAYTALFLYIIGRLIQAVTYTYISIVNPVLYLEVTGKKENG
ncbi:MAG: hypothetical protein ABH950_00165 [Candidatus Altiarchaeota archaeon]